MLNVANHQGNASQNHDEISPHTCQNGYRQNKTKQNKTKNTQITNVGKDVEKREPLYTVGVATLENSMKVSQKTKNRITT